MEKEFKEGDEVFIKGILIKNSNGDRDYPLSLKVNGKYYHESFTKDGKFYKEHESILHHISELKQEYPKYMMVSHNPITLENKGIKRYVLHGDETGYIAILREHSKCQNLTTYWKYAKDID